MKRVLAPLFVFVVINVKEKTKISNKCYSYPHACVIDTSYFSH